MEREGPFRPYAPPANVQAILRRLRRMNMPPRITRDFLKGAAISANIAPRVIAALRFLGLINENDEPTEVLRSIASSTEEEYRQLLVQTIHTAYAEEFQSIDPSKDPQERIHNTFQRYTPRSQHSRQIMLFLGLCREAGIPTVDAPRERRMRGRQQLRRPAGMVESRQYRQRPEGSGGLGMNKSNARSGELRTEQYLGITLEDAAHMPEPDFREAWNAIGTVFLRRAQRVYLTSQPRASELVEEANQGEERDGQH